MGDVGSFFIGGVLAGMALVTRLSLLLPIIALAMFLSSLSDIIQVALLQVHQAQDRHRQARLHAWRRCTIILSFAACRKRSVVTMYYVVDGGAVPAGAAGLCGVICGSALRAFLPGF